MNDLKSLQESWKCRCSKPYIPSWSRYHPKEVDSCSDCGTMRDGPVVEIQRPMVRIVGEEWDPVKLTNCWAL